MSLKSHALVEVEPSLYTVTRGDSSSLPPLKDREQGWGVLFGAGAGYYTPKNYDPNFITDSFENIYGSSKTPMVDVQIQLKKNFRRISFSGDLGVGFYSNTSHSNLVSSDVSFTIIRLGGTVMLDGILNVPYLVPYGSMGAYTNYYKETQGSVSFGGNSQVAIYYAFGAMILLDWIDPKSADRAYSEAGLQATYLYAEGRQYMKSQNASDPDFSTGLDPNVGIRLEF